MILAIEGPDGVGKTTLVNSLRPVFLDAHFVQFQDVPAVFYQHIVQIEPMIFRLFEQMYEPSKLYICDRFFSVSSRVYAKFHQRAYDLADGWVLPELHVIRLECEVEKLCKRRPQERDLSRLATLYCEVCEKLACASYRIIASGEDAEGTVRQVAGIVRDMMGDTSEAPSAVSSRRGTFQVESAGIVALTPVL